MLVAAAICEGLSFAQTFKLPEPRIDSASHLYYYYYDYQEEERLYNTELQLVSKIEQNGLGLEDRVDL